jgi:hypothetical protein
MATPRAATAHPPARRKNVRSDAPRRSIVKARPFRSVLFEVSPYSGKKFLERA